MFHDIIKDTPTYSSWKKIGIYPHHGINTPLFSLRTNTSLGIGEFYDLLPLIDLMAEVGMDILQILPINDTGKQASPYSALSSIALNPIYLTLTALADIEKLPHFDQLIAPLAKLEGEKSVIYSKVHQHKMLVLRSYFDQQQNSCQQALTTFVEAHPWVKAYATFCVLKEKNGQTSWLYWPEEEKNPGCLELFWEQYQPAILFYIFLQWLCFHQMDKVHQHAQKKGVFLKGDIPILLSPDSADVWFERENFLLDYTTGCPPDLFNYEGQNWGFPIFRWDYLKKTNYTWWERRLQFAEHFFDLYRIDHLVGFFRIWAIPLGKNATEGHFIPQNRYLWPFYATERIGALINSSSMLPIGEDLGIMPKEARRLLKSLGLTGTRVTRWVKYWEEDSSFIHSKDFDSLSVTTISTHDTTTMQQWWEQNHNEAKMYAKTRCITHLDTFDPAIREQVLMDAHSSNSIFHINLLGEYLPLFPELTSNDKERRINIPGVDTDNNWSLRYDVVMEKIYCHDGLRATLTRLVELTS